MGIWNAYFILKFGLLSTGYLNFHLIPNLVFATALILPVPGNAGLILRQIIAVPVGIILLYRDTWLPPVGRLIQRLDSILDFSYTYMLELAGRFITPELIGIGFVGISAYILLSQWLRLTTFTLLYLAWLTISPWVATKTQTLVESTNTSTVKQKNQSTPDDSQLDSYLAEFYQKERSRKTDFPDQPLLKEDANFDILFLSICSLSWDDLKTVGMTDNSLLGQMDMLFTNFNSATSYSGPAAIRLIRATCGQQTHAQLYEPTQQQCLLFDNLKALGFSGELAMNHDGRYENYLSMVQNAVRSAAPDLSPEGVRRGLVGFDGSTLWRDLDVLNRWWERRQNLSAPKVALFYNTLSLHDGNRIILSNGSTQLAKYDSRAKQIIDDINNFILRLQKSKRRILLVLIPEHGAALHGDRLQVSGMREIPSPAITHVPVGIKLIGMGNPPENSPLRVESPTSYLALSELVSRLYQQQAKQPDGNWDWSALLKDLPETAPVSENSGTVVMKYQGVPYIRFQERKEWLPYPTQ